MERVELLLPAGDKDSLRAAVANGADAVYLGLDAHNARRFAGNFSRDTLRSVVSFCRDRGVKVHVTANTLVKNDELRDYMSLVSSIGAAEADAVIMQDPWLVPLARESAPGCAIHLSTQATTANRYAVPEGVDRVILPREMDIAEIARMASAVPSEVFVHGALCLSYSGQCLFSSIAGGRSGNRGRCAQPCRRKYDGAYPLSTRDLCLLGKLPDIIGAGVRALKVEGRMRTPLYVGTAARIYRKYIDMHYSGGFEVDPGDIDDLMLAFSRDFTTGFAYNKSVVDASASTNRGVFLGIYKDGVIRLESDLKVGDGVMALAGERRDGNIVGGMRKGGEPVEAASKGDVVSVSVKGARDGDRIFKNLSAGLSVDLGDDFTPKPGPVCAKAPDLPWLPPETVDSVPVLCVRVRTSQGAADADGAGADVIYYDVFAEDFEDVMENVSTARVFAATPRIMDDDEVEHAASLVKRLELEGVLAGERGLPALLRRDGCKAEIHLDISHNIINDLDIRACGGLPILSPELSFDEMAGLSTRRFIAMVHGPLVLMTTREPLREGAMADEAGRRFRVRRSGRLTEVLNCSDLGLFNLTGKLLGAGVRYFYLDADRDAGKVVRMYRKIIAGEPFDDRRIRRGYTTGHFRRGVE